MHDSLLFCYISAGPDYVLAKLVLISLYSHIGHSGNSLTITKLDVLNHVFLVFIFAFHKSFT